MGKNLSDSDNVSLCRAASILVHIDMNVNLVTMSLKIYYEIVKRENILWSSISICKNEPLSVLPLMCTNMY